MSQNKQEHNPDTAYSAKEALTRAKSLRAELREQKADKERTEKEKKALKRNFWMAVIRRSCTLFTIFNLLHFLCYLLVVFPETEQTFSKMILGGTTIIGHLCFFGAALIASIVYSMLLYRRPQNNRSKFSRYLTKVCIWYTCLQFFTIALHGLYIDMIYNPYNVTEAQLLLGPSFLLSFSCLCFSVCICIANRILTLQRMNTALRMILHLTITLILSTVFFYGISSGFSSASNLFIFLIAFSLTYIICCIVYFAMRGAQNRDQNDEQEYENVYMTEEVRRNRAEQAAAKAKQKNSNRF